MKPNTTEQAGEGTAEAPGRLGDLLTMRMIAFFSLLRRSGVAAQRRMFDLSEVEWRIMVQLGIKSPVSLNTLAEKTLQDRGQLSRTVKGLVERGLLTRERRPGGPTVDICLSPAGRELHAGMVARAFERDRRLTQDLTAADRAALRGIIEKMIVRAEEMLEDERNEA